VTGARFGDPITGKIAAFLLDIGVEVRAGAVSAPTALPGIRIERAAIVIDEERLRFPGDVLHEAGHLAVVPSARRAAFHHDAGDDPAEEMMAIAWSYAAALHLELDPAIVFHRGGYRGGSAAILDSFTGGHHFGLPMLQYAGMAHDAKRAALEGTTPYPHMIRWLRP